jgi:hypothetical protein
MKVEAWFFTGIVDEGTLRCLFVAARERSPEHRFPAGLLADGENFENTTNFCVRRDG